MPNQSNLGTMPHFNSLRKVTLKMIRTLGVFFTLCISPLSYAAINDLFSGQYAHTVLSINAGYSCLEGSQDNQVYVSNGGNTYTYSPSKTNCQSKNYGFFIGNAYSFSKLFTKPALVQVGFDYLNFANTSFTGVNSVGITPALTHYNYAYKLQSQQVLANIRLIIESKKSFFPYLEGGIGTVIHKSHDYQVSTNQTGSINLTAHYNNLTTTRLSAALGAGAEKDINAHSRIGFGYRFNYLGSASLSPGGLNVAGNLIPVSFELDNRHIYAHQAFVRLSYLS